MVRHCPVLIRFSIRMLFRISAVYHCGNCHFHLSMSGMMGSEDVLFKIGSKIEIEGQRVPLNCGQNNGTSVFHNDGPQWDGYFCSSATFLSSSVEIIQTWRSDDVGKCFFLSVFFHLFQA